MTDRHDQKDERPIDNTRRNLALMLFGGVAGTALLEACGEGGSAEVLGQSPDIGGLAQALSVGIVAFETCADLNSNPGPSGSRQLAIAAGWSTPGDGGGGEFYWDPASTATLNTGTIFGSGVSGRWIRIHDGTINVKWFGARGDNSRSPGDYIPVYNACEYLRSLGKGALFFPAGTYFLEATFPYYLRPGSNTLIYGDGDASILVRGAGGGGGFEFVAGEKNARVTKLKFVLEHVIDFHFDIIAYRVTDLTIDHCTFLCTAPDTQFPPPLGTNTGIGVFTSQAIVTQECAGVAIHHNRLFRRQIKSAGAGGATRMSITHNFSEEAYDLAISCVSTEATGLLSLINISDNIILNPRSSGALFVGADGESSAFGGLQNAVISRNIITSTLPVISGTGIIMNLGQVNKDILIEGNQIDCATVVNNTYTQGISVASNDVGTAQNYTESLRVLNNTCAGFDLWGVSVTARGTRIEVSGNVTERCRGVRVAGVDLPTGGQGLDRVLVTRNNVLHGLINIDATAGRVLDAIVSENMVGVGGTFYNAGGINILSAGKQLALLCSENRIYDAGLVGGDPSGIYQSTTSGNAAVNYLGNDCRGVTTGATLNGPAIGYGNRGSGFPANAPTAGSWSVGDRVQNHSPAVGQPKGWVCTVAGAPGTWVSEGAL